MTSKRLHHIILFITLLLIGIFLRLQTLTIPLYDDAAAIPIIEKYHDALRTNLDIAPHGPLNLIFFYIGGKLFGVDAFGVRFTLLLFSFAYLLILYLFTKKVFGKRTACCAVLINLFSFFALYNYFIVEGDGVIQSFFSVILFFSFFLFFEEKQSAGNNNSKWWLALSIFTYVLLVAMKHRTSIFIIPIFLYSLYKTKRLGKSLLYLLLFILPSLLVLFLHIPIFYFVYGDMAPTLIDHILDHNKASPSLFDKLLNPHVFLTTIITLSPLLLFLPFLTLQRIKKQYIFIYSWISLLFVYVILIPLEYPYVKYIAGFLLPPLSILAAEAITAERIRLILKWYIIISIIVTSLLIIFLNNTIATDYWFFLEAMGPVVKVWQPIIYIVFFLCSLLFFYLFITRKKSYFRTAIFSIFIIFAVSFNILMITDTIIDDTHSLLIQEILDYVKDNSDLGQVYSWNEDIAFYLGNIGFYVREDDEPNFGRDIYDSETLREYRRLTGMGQQGYIDLNSPFEKIEPYLLGKGGTAFLLNYPYKYVVASSDDAQRKIRFFEENCIKEKEIVYKTGNLLIYRCYGTGN